MNRQLVIPRDVQHIINLVVIARNYQKEIENRRSLQVYMYGEKIIRSSYIAKYNKQKLIEILFYMLHEMEYIKRILETMKVRELKYCLYVYFDKEYLKDGLVDLMAR